MLIFSLPYTLHHQNHTFRIIPISTRSTKKQQVTIAQPFRPKRQHAQPRRGHHRKCVQSQQASTNEVKPLADHQDT
jgi:hypothetical protein